MSLKRTSSQQGEAELSQDERPATKLKTEQVTLTSSATSASPHLQPIASEIEIDTLPPFPSEEDYPTLQPPDITGDDQEKEEEDLILEQEQPELLPPFPSSHQVESDLTPPRLPTAEALDEDIILSGDEALDEVMSGSLTRSDTAKVESDVEEPEARGIDGLKLDPLRVFYEEENLLPAEEDQVVRYSYDEGFNERVAVWRGDITTLNVDGILNAANSSLLGGGGIDGAIHSAAGRGLLAECRTLGGAETGESKITGGHQLPSRKIIHTVGPIYSKSRKAECEIKLRSCYKTTFALAVENGLKSLALCGVSTGIYGYPLDDATRIALDEARSFLESPAGSSLDRLIFTVFRKIDVDSYVYLIPEFFPPPPTNKQPKDTDNTTVATESEGDKETTGDEIKPPEEAAPATEKAKETSASSPELVSKTEASSVAEKEIAAGADSKPLGDAEEEKMTAGTSRPSESSDKKNDAIDDGGVEAKQDVSSVETANESKEVQEA